MREKYSIDDIEAMLRLIESNWPHRNPWEQLRTYMGNGTSLVELRAWIAREGAKTPEMRMQDELQKRYGGGQATQQVYTLGSLLSSRSQS